MWKTSSDRKCVCSMAVNIFYIYFVFIYNQRQTVEIPSHSAPSPSPQGKFPQDAGVAAIEYESGSPDYIQFQYDFSILTRCYMGN